MTSFLLSIRRPISILLHALLIVFANSAAFMLRFDGVPPDVYYAMAWRLLPWLVAIRMAVFIPFGLFEGLWKYTSLWDLRNIIAGVLLSTIVFYPIAVINTADIAYPRSIYIIDSLLLVCLMTALRLTRRIYRELLSSQTGRRVLIYGAGDAGEMIVRDMRHNLAFNAVPIGFVDDDARKVGQSIHGVPVLGTRTELLRILEKHSPEEVLIAIPSASSETLRGILRAAEPSAVRITTLPRMSDLIGGRVNVHQIRQLKVEDLLARAPIGFDHEPVRRFLAGKKVLVTGAGGSIGSELCRQIAAAGPAQLVLLDRYENGLFQTCVDLKEAFGHVPLLPVIADIVDAARLDQLFDRVRPHIVFHAAAHKHVPLMEDNPSEAVKNNVRGTRLVAEAALRCHVERFVLISTDKAVNPTSVMGATKRLAEMVLERLHASGATRFSAVRFGNVLASNGSVVPTFLSQIAKGGPVTVTHPDMQRYFMLIPEAVQLVLHAAAQDTPQSLFVLDMGEQVKVVDMARDLIRLSGFVPDKEIAIRFTGVRPGEKLYEELVGDGERAVPSPVPKILHVTSTRSAPEGWPVFADHLRQLESAALEGRDRHVREMLCRLLPKFTPVAPVDSTLA